MWVLSWEAGLGELGGLGGWVLNWGAGLDRLGELGGLGSWMLNWEHWDCQTGGAGGLWVLNWEHWEHQTEVLGVMGLGALNGGRFSLWGLRVPNRAYWRCWDAGC